MAASASDKFQLISATGTVPNVPRVTATRSAAGTSLTVDNCNWDTTTGKIFSTYQVNTSGDVVAGTQTIWKGVVNSSTSIGSLTRLAGASDTGNAIGDYVEIIPDSEWAYQLVKGILTEHNQDGTHGDVTADSLEVSGTSEFTGAVTLPDSTVTTAKINDGAVTPAKLLAGTGTDWAWQAGTPNAAGFSSKTSDTLHYRQIGKTVFCRVNIDGTSNANTFTFTLPVAAGATQVISGLRVANNGAYQNTPGLISLTSGSTTATVQLTNTAAANAWTSSNAKALMNNFFYEAA